MRRDVEKRWLTGIGTSNPQESPDNRFVYVDQRILAWAERRGSGVLEFVRPTTYIHQIIFFQFFVFSMDAFYYGQLVACVPVNLHAHAQTTSSSTEYDYVNSARWRWRMYGILLARLILLRLSIRRVEEDDWHDIFQRVVTSCDS